MSVERVGRTYGARHYRAIVSAYTRCHLLADGSSRSQEDLLADFRASISRYEASSRIGESTCATCIR